jgi:hypothetical protein
MLQMLRLGALSRKPQQAFLWRQHQPLDDKGTKGADQEIYLFAFYQLPHPDQGRCQ